MLYMEEFKISKPETGSKMVTVRFKPSEYAVLNAKAEKAGVPLATMIRGAALFLMDKNVRVN